MPLENRGWRLIATRVMHHVSSLLIQPLRVARLLGLCFFLLGCFFFWGAGGAERRGESVYTYLDLS